MSTNTTCPAVTGPFDQTLFLGCSISNFNCNLGWGADQSTLSVTLANDPCRHPENIRYNTSVNIPIENALTTTVESRALHGIGNIPPIFDPLADRTKSLYKNIAKNILESENNRITSGDLGKKIPGIYNTSRRWTGFDPGFLGFVNLFSSMIDNTNLAGFDIMGVPVVFRFMNFSFGGFVSSWKANGSNSALQTIDVEIKSFSSLLNSCQLIIDKYLGTMCGIFPNTSNNPTGNDLAVPAPYGIDLSTANPTFDFFNHDATIKQGNIPNVFNIYGYLEYLGYQRRIFGNAGVNDEGMRAQFIYDSLISMIGTDSNLTNPDVLRFAPYGSILTRTIRSENGVSIDPMLLYNTNEGSISLTDLGICPNFIDSNGFRRSKLLLDISEVPRPPRWLRIQGPQISIMQFITEICDGAGFDFFVDFISPPSGAMYSGTIKIRTVSRRKQPRRNQIDAFINDVTNRVGVSSYSKGKEYSDANVRSMYIGGPQRRLVQMQTSRLCFKQNSLIYDPWANNYGGHWIDYGLDPRMATSTFNRVRMPNPLSTRRYSIRYNRGAAVCSDSNNFHATAYFGGQAVSGPLAKGNYSESVSISDGQAYIEGAAPQRPDGDAPTTLNIAYGDQTGNNIALYNDAICPFFGVGFGDLVRKVFFDKGMGQLQVLFHVQDIQQLTDLPLSRYNPWPEFNPTTGVQTSNIASSPVFLVLENEIRAAGAGFSSWLDYCFGNIFATDISMLIFKGFRDKYYFSSTGTTPGQAFNAGMDVIKKKAFNKNLITKRGKTLQVSLEDLPPKFRSLYADLEKIHAFFANIANQYYGKQYMVRGPALSYYIDSSQNSRILLGTDENNNPIYATEGTNKIFTNYTIPSDGAWEEPGNWIDDTMVVGGLRASSLCDESGKIPCLLGFNASSEKDYSKLWHRRQMLYYASLRRFSDSPSSHYVIDYEFVMERQLNDPILNGNHYYASINHSFDDPTSYIKIPYNNLVTFPMAHGEDVPNAYKYKLYAKADVAGVTTSSLSQMPKGFAFMEPGYINPRIILSLPSPVYIGQKKNNTDIDLSSVMHQDSLLFLLKGPKIPDLVRGIPSPDIFGVIDNYIISRNKTILQGFTNNIEGTAAARSTPGAGTASNFGNTIRYVLHDLIGANSLSVAADKSDILQKAAIPMFCALPVEFNTLTYGPWINHPGLIQNDIFEQVGRTDNRHIDIENLIGGVKVNVDPTLVPWNFGGMTQLDDAVMLKITDDINYQQIIETATVQIPGFDNYSLGDMIQYFGNLFDGPVINSIQVQISDNGIITTYNFRTYIKKLGLFNKENADRIKAIGQESLKRNKEISAKIRNLSTKLGIY